MARLEGNASSDGVSTTTLGQKLNLDKSSTSRRAKEALARGYLKNLEDKRGRAARLVLGDPLPDEIAVLPIKETLETKCCTVAPLKQGTDVPPSPAAIEEEEMAWTV